MARLPRFGALALERGELALAQNARVRALWQVDRRRRAAFVVGSAGANGRVVDPASLGRARASVAGSNSSSRVMSATAAGGRVAQRGRSSASAMSARAWPTQVGELEEERSSPSSRARYPPRFSRSNGSDAVSSAKTHTPADHTSTFSSYEPARAHARPSRGRCTRRSVPQIARRVRALALDRAAQPKVEEHERRRERGRAAEAEGLDLHVAVDQPALVRERDRGEHLRGELARQAQPSGARPARAAVRLAGAGRAMRRARVEPLGRGSGPSSGSITTRRVLGPDEEVDVAHFQFACAADGADIASSVPNTLSTVTKLARYDARPRRCGCAPSVELVEARPTASCRPSRSSGATLVGHAPFGPVITRAPW